MPQDRSNVSRLDEIEARLKAATPGPWYSDGEAKEWSEKSSYDDSMGMGIYKEVPKDKFGCSTKDIVVGGCQDEQGGAIGVLSEADADLISSAPDDLAWLISEVKRLRKDGLALWARYVKDGWDRADDDLRDLFDFTSEEQRAALDSHPNLPV
jgi:hypothetical protein